MFAVSLDLVVLMKLLHHTDAYFRSTCIGFVIHVPPTLEGLNDYLFSSTNVTQF
jgi:hypothetical protein